MPRRPRRSNLKLAAAFFLALASLLAQDLTNYLTPDVVRVGDKLACRCGGCKNTVGTCPMLHCGSADPMRRKIYDLKAAGMSDTDIVSAIVREEGAAVLALPPRHGILVWMMPGIALLIGFYIYTSFVRRNRKQPEPLSAADQATIERFRAQIDRELDESPQPGKARADPRK